MRKKLGRARNPCELRMPAPVSSVACVPYRVSSQQSRIPRKVAWLIPHNTPLAPTRRMREENRRQSATAFPFAPISCAILRPSEGSIARIISAMPAVSGGFAVATRGRLLGRAGIFSFLTCL